MKFIIFLFLLFSLEALAEKPSLKESPYRLVKPSIGQGKPFFLEIGSESCHSCVVMGHTLYEVSQKYPEYNLHFINVKKERDVAFELSVRMIPTQIIYDKVGKEVYRHIGVLSPDELTKLFRTYAF